MKLVQTNTFINSVRAFVARRGTAKIKSQLHVTFAAQVILLMASGGPAKLACAASGTLPPATSISYKVTTVSLPGAQFNNCFVNDVGIASGTFTDAANHLHGYIWQDGIVSVVERPGFSDIALSSLNNKGIVTAQAGGAPALYNLRDHTWTDLPVVPGLPFATAVAINDSDLVLGFSYDANGLNAAGWTWDGHSYRFFTVPQADGPQGGTEPNCINDKGQITGLYADNQGNIHGFLKDGLAITAIDVPGAADTFPVGINNDGDIAGFYFFYDPEFTIYGFVLHDGQFASVDILGSSACGLSKINDRGELSGLYADAVGNFYGFIAKPHGPR